jgi:hypothetical protein
MQADPLSTGLSSLINTGKFAPVKDFESFGMSIVGDRPDHGPDNLAGA